jgi:Family of unknown function (DUF6338)
VIEALAALGAAWLVHRLLRRGTKRKLEWKSSWERVLREQRPEGMEPYVLVSLNNGTTYVGRVADYTPDLDWGDRELVLSPPLFLSAKDAGLAELVAMTPMWERIVIPASSIVDITVAYAPPPQQQHAAPSSAPAVGTQ